jgi:NAD(P)-dependent dehydrogenase (short-subunit alcohol dehydrogenase family)
MTDSTRTAIITGANSGLGLHCARSLLAADPSSHVVLAVRDPARGAAPVQRLGAPQRCTIMQLDLASLRSVRGFIDDERAAELPPIHTVVCNAAVQMVSGAHTTADGYEMTFGVNHLGHFALVCGLLDTLTAPARIVVVSSGTHDPAKFTGMPHPHSTSAADLAHPPGELTAEEGRRRYTTSKLCNLLFTYELDRRMQHGAQGVTVKRVRSGNDARLGSRSRLPAAAAVRLALRTACTALPARCKQHPYVRALPRRLGSPPALRRCDGHVLRGQQARPVVGRLLRHRQSARVVGDQRAVAHPRAQVNHL